MARRAKPVKLGWGEGSIRQRGDRFQVRWREAGERRSLSFGSRLEAEDELEKVRARIALGQPGHVPAQAPKAAGSIEELVADWEEYRVQHGVRMAAEDKARWALHLAAPLSTTTLEAVSARWVRELASELVKPTTGSKAPDGSAKHAVSGPTAHRILTLLSAFFQWCVDEEHLEANPARTALRHKDSKKQLRSKFNKDARPRLKSWAEVGKLALALEGSVRTAYLLGARAGLRPGETVALTWGDVDLEARTIQVSKQVRSGKLGPTKGDKARTVPIVEALAHHLEAIRGAAKDHDLVAPPDRRTKKNGRPGSFYGTYLGPKSIREGLASAFTSTGIKPGDFYDYGRRTFATLAALGGLDLPTLQAIMGHRDIRTTMLYIAVAHQQPGPKTLAALGG